jgi:hypothetical protein
MAVVIAMMGIHLPHEQQLDKWTMLLGCPFNQGSLFPSQIAPL